ncbi:hypothetical protein CDV55_105624 [Aspergillus turcosus]|nr:hypothetical protein CDV55_105624 [Aspergillus turcosus]
MAPQKSVTEVPRSLLPRLTWNGSSSRITVAPPQSNALSTLRLQPQQRIQNLSPPDDTGCKTPVYITERPEQSSSSRGPQQSYQREHHFDTLRFVQRLKDEGFSEEQAVAMMRVLNDVIQESIQHLTRTMVLREDTERSAYTQKVDFAKLRSELLNADSTEAQLTRSSHEKIAADLAKLNSRLRDEIGRTQASVRLDLNLEKGRIREEANGQEMRIKETETRIEQEVAGLRERVEAVKFSTLQWLMGVCTGTAALILGAWRLFM